MTESTGPSPIVAESAAHPAFGLTDVLLFAMAVIWGVNFVVVKYATHIFNPVAFTGLRVGTAATFLVAFAYVRGGFTLSRHDVLRLLFLGVIGNGLYQLFFVHGVARTRAGNASLIVGAAPAFIALVARARGLERVKRMTLAGIALSVIGVALVIAGSATSSNGDATFLGSVLVFLGVLSWTAYTIMLQPYTKRVDVIQLSAVTLVGGAVPLLVASMPALVATDWSSIGAGGWLALFYSSVISMGVAYFFWYRGLRVLGPTRAAVYSNLQPIVALVAAWAFLGEIPTIFQGVGAVTIIAGVFLTRT
ncbi:MAG TPA: DMT family transporter [Gemmatimonadaceae bacterium]|nr:DMT family transporter [Gemmatimonadaceae bacterium]